MKTAIRLFMRNSKYAIVIGFGLVLLLMVTITVIGLVRMHTINQQMETIVRDRETKNELVTQLRTLSRERAVTIYSMLLMKDSFQLDDAVQHFSRLAGEFIRNRDELLQLNLNPVERATLLASQHKTQVSTQLMGNVVELIQAGKLAQAQEILQTQAIPAQQQVFSLFNQLIEMEQRYTRVAVSNVARDYWSAVWMVGMLGSMAFVLGIGIMILVVRKSIRIERALFQEKERAEVTLHSIGDAVISTNLAGNVDYINPVAEQLTGWGAAEAYGQPFWHIFNTVDEISRQSLDQPFAPDKLDGWMVGLNRHAVLVSKTGAEFSIESSVTPIRNHGGDTIGFVSVFHDVTVTRNMAQQLSWQASHDSLTGLTNRREFECCLTDLLNSAKKMDTQHILLYMDLDQFKLVNDTSGHGAGDELLRQLAAIIQSHIRTHDTLARLGGDEFGVLLRECTIEQGCQTAEKLRQVIAEFRFIWKGKTFEVGVSMGLVEVNADAENIAALLSAADAACYMAKDKGRNRVWVHQKDNAEMLQRYGEMQWVARITHAFEEQRFLLYYQNIVAVQPNQQRKEYCEILLRLEDESGELVSPMSFIPAAERYGMMPLIDRWVIRTMFKWLLENPGSTEQRCYAINISGQSLGDEHFVGFVIDQFHESGISGEVICFEVTETAAIANLSQAMRFISVLKGIGCRFSLDDFGSGMSSFAYLKNLQVDSVKIDGAFVRDMVADAVDYAMVEAINRIGQVMGIQTVAEFVENDAILKKLEILGVDYAQGYGIHKPAPLHLLCDKVRLSARGAA
jgi:diguanylate cyclase (GGDEF)-like protein/PAS domain S-box-containing protein